MSDPRELPAERRNWLERILLKIPGFSNYLEKEYRRESDHLLRLHLSQRLGEGKQRLNEAVRAALDAGRLGLLGKVPPVANLLEQLDSRIRFASHGYSGFFDAVKIGEKELDALYAFDAGLLNDLDGLLTDLNELPGVAGDETVFTLKLNGIQDRLRALDTAWNGRQDRLMGLSR